MPLFQQSVIKKHIDACDAKHIEERWRVFKSIFHTAEKQANIRNSKEEQYQEGFLRDLFVNVLGYTINPEPNFNLLTEQKNVNNSKKADGAILLDGKVLAVIELKGTETSDLNKIEAQAFGYKNNQPGCNYVITSNFEKLRFYIDNTTQQEEFNLFTLTKSQFELLYACLAWESIKNNVPNHLLNESVSKENTITKSLYKDYSEFKRALFVNMVEFNPQFDKLVLFKKTQKLLDRFLFIFFAEDRGLLPTNLIFRINKEWENILSQRMQVSLYDRYIMYFNDLNVGAKVTLPAFGKKTGEAITAEFEIFAYNGGLFVPDEILDNIKIDDALLHSYTQKMSHYNFESDVDVNILGHIFENSLNEIDEIKSELEGNVLEKTKTRRKKDGVFYTPKYITKYIVDNTVGKLCAEKKAAMKLNDEDFVTAPSAFESPLSTGVKHTKTKKKALLDKLSEYRNWLLDLTICDPACGSGAFLNQALEFLIAEHRYVDELQAKLLGESLVLSDVEKSILERNLYGVDLNDESVEIAKLSLWLRTAQKGRKLNSLNNNIKCGNSLIDDPAVAGDKAFSWEKEFPEVFKVKNKYAYHVTASIHDSRTSQRMIDYHARERRFGGMKPAPEVNYMTKEEEELIAKTVSEIVKEDKLNIAAFNLCRDHMHILLVCEEHEVPKIMHKIKGRTARICNAHIKGKSLVKGNYPIKGINPLGGKETTNPLEREETTNPLGREETTNPLGREETTNPFGREETTNPLGSTDTTNPLGREETTNPFGREETTNPFGREETTNPLGREETTNPFGREETTNPHGSTDTITKLKDGSTPFWTQKYGCNPITSDEHYWNTVNYIEKNKAKHKLPNNPKLQGIIRGFVKTYEECFKTEYTGGFDVVIGNPPYLRVQGIKENHKTESLFIENHYKSAIGRYDLYILFIEKSTKIINPKGKVSFILPHNFLAGNLGGGIRKLLSKNKLIEEILHFGSNLVFSDASTYTCILGLSLDNKNMRYASVKPALIFNSINFEKIDYSQVSSDNWQLNSRSNQVVLDKINKNKLNVAHFFSDVARGIVSGFDDVFILTGEIINKSFKGYSKELDKQIEIEAALVRPILMGNSASRYQKLQNEKFIIYPHIRRNGKTVVISEDELKLKYPLTFSYLSNFKEILTNKKIKYKTNPDLWYGLHNSRDLNIFECKKIITPYLANICQMAIDDSDNFITNDKCSVLILKPEYNQLYEFFLGILNSKLMWFFIGNTSSEFSGGYFAFTNLFLNPFPCPDISKNTLEVTNNVKIQLVNTENYQIIKQKFSTYFSSNYHLDKLSNKLSNWYELEFVDFIKELNKAIKAVKGTPLTKKDEFEWMDLFEENKKKAVELKAEIDKTDKEIDQMVYQLYDLTEDEIRIVENVQ